MQAMNYLEGKGSQLSTPKEGPGLGGPGAPFHIYQTISHEGTLERSRPHTQPPLAVRTRSVWPLTRTGADILDPYDNNPFYTHPPV